MNPNQMKIIRQVWWCVCMIGACISLGFLVSFACYFMLCVFSLPAFFIFLLLGFTLGQVPPLMPFVKYILLPLAIIAPTFYFGEKLYIDYMVTPKYDFLYVIEDSKFTNSVLHPYDATNYLKKNEVFEDYPQIMRYDIEDNTVQPISYDEAVALTKQNTMGLASPDGYNVSIKATNILPNISESSSGAKYRIVISDQENREKILPEVDGVNAINFEFLGWVLK